MTQLVVEQAENSSESAAWRVFHGTCGGGEGFFVSGGVTQPFETRPYVMLYVAGGDFHEHGELHRWLSANAEPP